jgi:hypothetical protein
MWIQAKKGYRFLRPVKDINQAMQDMANQVKDSSVVIHAGETKEMPEWVRDNWMFEALIEEGHLIEVVMPKPKKKKSISSGKSALAAPAPEESEPSGETGRHGSVEDPEVEEIETEPEPGREGADTQYPEQQAS